jgi:hypothetical protein
LLAICNVTRVSAAGRHLLHEALHDDITVQRGNFTDAIRCAAVAFAGPDAIR